MLLAGGVMMICNKKHTNSLAREQARKLTLEEKKNLKRGNHVYIEAPCGCLLQVKVNGKPKTWKCSPEEVEIPFKYGLWEYGYIYAITKTYVLN